MKKRLSCGCLVQVHNNVFVCDACGKRVCHSHVTAKGGKIYCEPCHAKLPKGYVWKSEGKLYMTYCPECGRENYAHAVSSGQCAWCGYKAREKDLG